MQFSYNFYKGLYNFGAHSSTIFRQSSVIAKKVKVESTTKGMPWDYDRDAYV